MCIHTSTHAYIYNYYSYCVHSIYTSSHNIHVYIYTRFHNFNTYAGWQSSGGSSIVAAGACRWRSVGDRVGAAGKTSQIQTCNLGAWQAQSCRAPTGLDH